MEDFRYDARHVIDLPAFAGHEEGGREMSEQNQERQVHAKRSDEDTGDEDVEGHVRSHRGADASAEEDADDVEAHVRHGKDT
jgi:hypothetical protein